MQTIAFKIIAKILLKKRVYPLWAIPTQMHSRI